MKFCTNCGAQIDDAASVCPSCGAVVAGAPSAQNAAPAQGAYMQGAQMNAAPNYAPAAQKKISVGGIIATVGYVLMLISMFIPLLSSYGVTVSLYQGLGLSGYIIDSNAGTVILIVLIAAVVLGLVAGLLSIFTKSKIFLIIMTVINTILAVLVVGLLIYAKSESGTGSMVRFSIGFYLWIIGIVVAIVGTAINARKR